ncbi:MAG: hypothetical protein KTR31_32690 [Myxococcales bacterium]|nr:hypothetical protein [Myxococcales bacterium]
MSPETLEELMVKVVDDVATPAERQALMTELASRPDLQVELDAHLALKATTDGWVERVSLDALEDRVATHPVARMERVVGWSLLGGGASVLGGFGLVELWLAEAPLWVRGGSAAMLAGLAILLLSVIRWRRATWASDKYTEVIR